MYVNHQVTVYSRLSLTMDKCIRTLAEPKENYNLVVTGNSSSISTTFDPPLYLLKDKTYELALTNLETYYSFPNIDNTNNSFRYSSDSGTHWKPVKIPIGCYEIRAINAEIVRQVTNKSITVKPNKNTLQSVLTIASNYIVDFSGDNSLATVLGFKKQKYTAGTHTSEDIVNILRVNSILVHTDIITGSYLAGKQVPVLYNFFPNVRPGDKIVTAPINLIYSPVTVDVITHMNCWLSDQNHNAINLRGELLTIRFHLRER